MPRRSTAGQGLRGEPSSRRRDFDLEGGARVESLDIDEENLKAHLLSPEFFDVERHPEIRFSADEIDDSASDWSFAESSRSRATGGASRRPPRSARPSPGPAGKKVVGLDLETVIDRNEFGLTWNADLPGGGKVLADDVRLVVHLELVQEEV